MSEIKLSTIAQVGQIEPHTLPYLLKMATDLTAGQGHVGRGNHRVFTPEQAWRIVVVALVMDWGFTLPQAGKILKFSEARMNQVDYYIQMLKKTGKKDPSFPGDPSADFRLWILDRRYLCADRIKEPLEHEKLQWMDLATITMSHSVPKPVSVLSLNLSLIQTRLLEQAGS